MKNFSMTCSCGDVMSFKANTVNEAQDQAKQMMNAQAIADHFAQKHAGQPVPPIDQVHMMIDKEMKEVMV